jgi:lipopolysaccharide/colanic/teichoic acid biosynthesis glycosyltransferase
VKRAFDLLVGGALLLVSAPVTAVIALLTRVLDGPPAFFRQARSGRGGRPFTMVKIRTMRPPRPHEQGPEHDEARLTHLGRTLRATSLDELPTFWHVVRGQMSLVGPRPLSVAYLQRYTDEQARRLEVRPGVTGWAQVNGRNTTSWAQRLAMDVWYVDHRSMALDLRILAATVAVVLRRSGIDQADGVTMTEFRGTSEADA